MHSGRRLIPQTLTWSGTAGLPSYLHVATTARKNSSSSGEEHEVCKYQLDEHHEEQVWLMPMNSSHALPTGELARATSSQSLAISALSMNL
jgi:hypothetical protein